MIHGCIDLCYKGLVLLQNGWKVVSSGGTVFEDVDLREDWVEYCEKLSESVGVYQLEGRFVRK
jgi:hypothetical protein